MASTKSNIEKFVRDYGYVTFPELLLKVKGLEGDQYLALPGLPNTWLWSGLSAEAADAIIELLGEKKIFVHPASEITKLSYGGFLNIPEAKSARKYMKPHWFICVLHHAPFVEGN